MPATSYPADFDVELDVKVRELKDDDWALVLNSYKKGYRDSWDIPAHVYFPQMHGRIEKLRERGARFVVACDPEDDDFILGWACMEPPVLHYAYVKQPFREQGVASKMVQSDAAFFDAKVLPITHWTQACERIDAKRPNFLLRVDL